MQPQESEALLRLLQARFDAHPQRHAGCAWAQAEARLREQPASLAALQAMEATGGEPDVIGFGAAPGSFVFADCAAESPAGRRSLCWDHAALVSRKENRPAHCAVAMAAQMGVDILTEDQYRHLQTLGTFDTRTSSWVQTPADIRQLGGALFCDRRYGHVFTYHNGAASYYAARGFRAQREV